MITLEEYLSPDREKLAAFANVVRALVLPQMATNRGIAAALTIETKIRVLVGVIEHEAKDMEATS